MNARNQLLIKGVAGLLALWAVVFFVAKFAGSMKPTPDKIREYVESHPVSELEDQAARHEVIGKVADMLNQLEPEQFAEFSKGRNRKKQENFFRNLSREDQQFFMERRLGKAFNQMMKAFNQMDREKRKKLVERSLKRMLDNPGRGPAGERLENMDPEIAEKITAAGLKAYYQDASAETKLDLAPLMEEMQRGMSRFGGGRL